MFKRTVTIFLILVMSLQSVWKLGLVTYFEMNREYIAKVLCVNKAKPEKHCNGQCYLKKRIKNTEEKEQLPSGTSREKSEFLFFIIEDFDVALINTHKTTVGGTGYLEQMTRGFLDDDLRPPSC